eukprot:6396755-Pyramimonas_sp.AAC.1
MSRKKHLTKTAALEGLGVSSKELSTLATTSQMDLMINSSNAPEEFYSRANLPVVIPQERPPVSQAPESVQHILE